MVKKNKKYSAAIIEKVNGLKESGNSKIDQTYERVSSTRMNVGKSLKNTITKRKFEMINTLQEELKPVDDLLKHLKALDYALKKNIQEVESFQVSHKKSAEDILIHLRKDIQKRADNLKIYCNSSTSKE